MSELWENALKEEGAEGRNEGRKELLEELIKKGLITKQEAEKIS